MIQIQNSEFKTFNSLKGFSLIELLIYMGILSTILVVLSTTFGSIIDSSLSSRAVSSTQQDGRYIILKLTYDIERAATIISPSLGNSASSLQVTIGGSTVTYQLDGAGNLTLADLTGTDMLNSYDASISALTFQRLGNVGGKNSILITFTATGRSIAAKGSEVANFKTAIATR